VCRDCNKLKRHERGELSEKLLVRKGSGKRQFSKKGKIMTPKDKKMNTC
jgi:hypothetical protein